MARLQAEGMVVAVEPRSDGATGWGFAPMAARATVTMLHRMARLHRLDHLARIVPSALAGLLVGVAALDLARLAVVLGPAACAVGVLVALGAGAWCGRELLRRSAPGLVRTIAVATVTVVAASHIGEVSWVPATAVAELGVLAALGATLAALQARAARHAPAERPVLRLLQGGAA